VYSADVLLNFFVAFYEDGQLVTDLARIASHYAQWRLWLDLVRGGGWQESNIRVKGGAFPVVVMSVVSGIMGCKIDNVIDNV
jgi:hypothetical protein